MKAFIQQEAYVRKQLRKPLAPLVRLMNDALRLGVRMVQSETKHDTKAQRAAYFLATRLLSDARTCELVAQNGYALQSLALAANAFELAYRALYIRDDESRAAAWAAHVDLHYSYPRSVLEAVRDVYESWGRPADDGELIYRNRYQPLAAAKHANPHALSRFGLLREGDVLHVFLGPTFEPASIKACKVAIAECSRLVGLVLSNLVRRHMADARKKEFGPRLDRLYRRTERLHLELLTPAT